ncbi:hypothetical protein KA078_02625 [Candidatus Woesebacteria bacterium]|nr:hypothetical protein [Candidatus Woesebacteria bacterium]
MNSAIESRYNHAGAIHFTLDGRYETVEIHSLEPVMVRVTDCDPFELYVTGGDHIVGRFTEKTEKCSGGEFYASFTVQGQQFHLVEGKFIRVEVVSQGLMWVKVSLDPMVSYVYVLMSLFLLLIIGMLLDMGVTLLRE